MSSHHIVRENQEPALWLYDIAATSGDIIGQLLEWSPAVYVGEDQLYDVLDRGIKVDFVLRSGRATVGQLGEQLRHQWPVRLIEPGEDPHQLFAAYPGVHICASSASRDHFVPLAMRTDVLLHTDDGLIQGIRKGIWRKWCPKDTYVAVWLPATTQPLAQWQTTEDGLCHFEYGEFYWVWLLKR